MCTRWCDEREGLSSGSAPRYQGRRGDVTARWRVEFYKPVILICPSSSRRMLKERGGNRCFKRDETHGRARRPQGSRPGPWAALCTLAGGRQVTCCSQMWPLDHCFLVGSFCWVRSTGTSTVCGGQRAPPCSCAWVSRLTLGTAGVRPSQAQGKVWGPPRLSVLHEWA